MRDEELNGKKIDEVMFCNLKESCINLKKKCNDMEINKKSIQKELLKEILSQFEEKFHITIEQLRRTLKKSYDYNLENIQRLQFIHKMENVKWE